MDKVCFFVPQIIPPTGLPLLIDGDTGCGEARNVMPMIRSFKDVGAAAVTNRGPSLPGKRGPLNDNKVADLHDMAARIAAAQRARAELHATIEYHDYEALNASIVTTTIARATPRRVRTPGRTGRRVVPITYRKFFVSGHQRAFLARMELSVPLNRAQATR